MKTHLHRCACAAYVSRFSVFVYQVVECLCGDVGDAAASRAARITELSSENRWSQAVAENTLVQTVILDATARIKKLSSKNRSGQAVEENTPERAVNESPNVGGDGNILVLRARKMD